MSYRDEETNRAKPMCGKANFVGFCADLAAEVAKIVKFDYDICVVKDSMYGERLTNETWNGMIGELTRNVSERMRIECYMFLTLEISLVWRVIHVYVRSIAHASYYIYSYH